MSVLQFLNNIYDDEKEKKLQEEQEEVEDKDSIKLPINSMIFFYNEDND